MLFARAFHVGRRFAAAFALCAGAIAHAQPMSPHLEKIFRVQGLPSD